MNTNSPIDTNGGTMTAEELAAYHAEESAKDTVSPRVTLKSEDGMEKRVLAYLLDNVSDTLAAKINAGTKTLRGAMNYATDEAKKIADGKGSVCVDDATVFGWIVHFFEEDSVTEKAAPTPRPAFKAPKGVTIAQKAAPANEAAGKAAIADKIKKAAIADKIKKAAIADKIKAAAKAANKAKSKPGSKLAASASQMSLFNSLFGGGAK